MSEKTMQKQNEYLKKTESLPRAAKLKCREAIKNILLAEEEQKKLLRGVNQMQINSEYMHLEEKDDDDDDDNDSSEYPTSEEDEGDMEFEEEAREPRPQELISVLAENMDLK